MPSAGMGFIIFSNRIELLDSLKNKMSSAPVQAAKKPAIANKHRSKWARCGLEIIIQCKVLISSR
jgi:hypothetical protein